jgi:choice-of-anchor A domain-containing protein
MMLRCGWRALLSGAALTVVSCGPSSVEPSPEPAQTAESAAHQESDAPHTTLASSPPVALCTHVTVGATSTCSFPASINNGSYDPDGDLQGCSQSPPSPYVIGTTAVTLTCTDRTGLRSSCTGTVTVTDKVLPVVHVSPQSQTVQCANGSTYSYMNGVTADDLCEGTLPSANIWWSGTVNMGQLRSSTVNYQVKDGSNNLSAPVPRTVTVVDTLPPLLSLLGAASMPLECGTTFTDPGALATDVCLGPVTSWIVKTGTVNPGAVGSYSLRYDVSDGRNSATPVTRTVTVSDTRKPMVTLVGPLSQTVECGAPYADPGAIATDLCAGSLPVVMTNPVNPLQPGTYVTQYKATDPSGNTAFTAQSRIVTVADTLPPVLTLLGPAVQELECSGSPFEDPGATAADTCSGDLTPSIVVTSNLNQSQTGEYTVTYSVQDAAGNTSTAVRQLTVGPCVRCFSIHLSGATLFLLESYTGGHDVEGKVAAGGTISLTDFAVGVRLPGSDIANTLVAGGDLTLSRGGVWGDAWYGGSYGADPSVVYPHGTVAQGTPIDFAARFTELRSLSSRLGGLPAHGVTTLEPWGGIMLRGTDPSLNVFDVNASAFSGAALWSIDAPAGSLVVVNIRGASATFSGFGTFFSGGIDQHDVLYNFVDATQIDAQGFGFWGTVLAPQANVTFNNGSWDGGIYARSLTGNAAGHSNPLNDRELCP